MNSNTLYRMDIVNGMQLIGVLWDKRNVLLVFFIQISSGSLGTDYSAVAASDGIISFYPEFSGFGEFRAGKLARKLASFLAFTHTGVLRIQVKPGNEDMRKLVLRSGSPATLSLPKILSRVRH